MLYEIINELSTFQSKDSKDFWEKVSAENSQDFLLSYRIPSEFKTASISDFKSFYSLVSEDIIEADDEGQSLLGAAEVKLVTLLVLLKLEMGT